MAIDLGTAVGVVSLGIQLCQGLITYYDGWRAYESDIEQTYQSIDGLYKTLLGIRDLLDRDILDEQRAKRLDTRLRTLQDALGELAGKAREFKKYDRPQGLRQKAKVEWQKLWYPFYKSTMSNLRSIVDGIHRNVTSGILELQLELNIRSTEEIVGIRESVQDMQSRAQFREVREWLAPSDPWLNHNLARNMHETNTGRWLLNSSKYHDWKAGKHRHLWLSGKVGCGKTVLCSSVVEDIMLHCQARKRSQFAIFYFSYSDQTKQTSDDLLRSVLAQLGAEDPGLQVLKKAHDVSRHRQTAEAYRKLLISMLQETAYKEVILLMDALDEIPEEKDKREDFLEMIQKLSVDCPNLRIFATSREKDDINRAMASMKTVKLSTDTADINADVLKYVTSQMLKNRRLSELGRIEPMLIEETLTLKADGMFRWVYCQLQVLKRLKNPSKDSLRAALKTLPLDLDETYERTLLEISKNEVERDSAVKLLGWIAFARTPPTLGDLNDVLIIDIESGCINTDDRGLLRGPIDLLSDLIEVISPERGEFTNAHPQSEDNVSGFESESEQEHSERLKNAEVRGASVAFIAEEEMHVQQNELKSSFESGLTTGDDVLKLSHPLHDVQDESEVRQVRVRLAHFSVKEYLSSKRFREKSPSEIRGFYLDNTKIHDLMAQYCIVYLLECTERFRKLIPLISVSTPRHGDDDPFIVVKYMKQGLRQFCLLKYAATTWYYHSKACSTDNRDCFQELRLLGSADAVRVWLFLHYPERGDANHWPDIRGRWNAPSPGLYYASLLGLAKVVQELLESGADINTECGFFGTPLIAASAHGNREVVQLLLQRNAKVNLCDHERTALYQASSSGHEHIVQLLLNAGADANVGFGDRTPLTAAILGGNIALAEVLLNHGAVVETNVLTAACKLGDQRLVRKLLEANADVNIFDTFHEGGPLSAALLHDHEDVAQILIDHEAQAGSQRRWNQNATMSGYVPRKGPLRIAAERGLVNTLRSLLATDNLPGDSESNKREALVSAAGAESANEDVIRLLLAAGTALEPNSEGRTALEVASGRGHLNLVELLINAGANATAEANQRALGKACKFGHEAIVRMLLDAGADVNVHAYKSETALMMASRYNQEAIVRILLRAGAEVNAMSEIGTSALGEAIANGNQAIVQHLLEAGADVNLVLTWGRNFKKTMSCEHENILQILLNAGADPNAISERNSTALSLASACGFETAVRVLIRAGANANVNNGRGTALMSASKGGHVTIVEMLLQAGADVNARPELSGDTALTTAASEGHKSVVQILLRAGADADARDYRGRTALILASGKGYPKVVKILLGSKLDLNVRDDGDDTALTVAARRGYSDIVRLLIAAGSDLEIQGWDGSALMPASAYNKRDVVEMLIKTGVKTDGKDREGITALRRSIRFGYLNRVDWLIAVEMELGDGCWDDIKLYQDWLEIMKMLLQHGAEEDEPEEQESEEQELDENESVSLDAFRRMLSRAGAVAFSEDGRIVWRKGQ